MLQQLEKENSIFLKIKDFRVAYKTSIILATLERLYCPYNSRQSIDTRKDQLREWKEKR